MNKKKLGCFMLSAMLATSVTIPQAFAVKQDTAKTYQISLRVEGMSVYMLNEKKQELPAIFYNDSYYMSLRTAGEWLGKNVSWNGDTKTISFTGTTQPKFYKASDVNTNDFIKYTSGGDVNITQRDDITVLIDGKEQKFYTESNNIIYPIMYNDSTYLPVRSIANLLDMSIDWKNATETTAAQISLTNDLSDEQRKVFNEYKKAVQTQFEKYIDLASGLYPNKENSDELKKILGNMDECLDNVLQLNVDIPKRQNVIDLVNNTAKNQKQMIDEAYSAIKTQTSDELFAIEHGQATGILMKLYTASEVSNTLGALGVFSQSGQAQADNQVYNLPAEANAVVIDYMNAFKKGTSESVKYMNFENDFLKSAYIDSNDKLLDYKIENVKKINDNLYSIEISAKTESSKFYSGETYQKAFNFVGYIDGKWKYMNGVSEIPDSIRDNLNVDDFKNNDENIVNSEDIYGGSSYQKYENKELGFSVEFPSTWKDNYTVELNTPDKSSSSVVVKTSWGGILCYIFRETQEQWKESQQIESPVDYTILAENDKYVYKLIPASDVQYDVNNKEQVKIYNDMRNDLNKIKFEII